MTFTELAAFNSSSIKRGDEALKIEFAAANTGRKVPYATVGEFLSDGVRQTVEGLVTKHFSSTWLQRIDEKLRANPTDKQIADVASALGVDLNIPVPL